MNATPELRSEIPPPRTPRVRTSHAGWMLVLLLGALVVPQTVVAQAQEDSPFFRQPFRRGDGNLDGWVDIADVIHQLAYLFLGTVTPDCRAASDSNGNGRLDITDAVYNLEFLFDGAPPPPHPGPDNCGTEIGGLACRRYDACRAEPELVFHALERVTFGPTPELLTELQTRADVVRFIEEQLAAPANFRGGDEEPALEARIDRLRIGFREGRTPGSQVERLKSLLLANAIDSEWQLLHVVTQFWNNHFHTSVDSLAKNFFERPGLGGTGTPASPAIFEALDNDGSGFVNEREWESFGERFETLVPWEELNRFVADGRLTRQEFLERRGIAFWKYGSATEQLGVSADLERREYEFFRRNAFGDFRSLLEGSAKSSAMILYLNGFENTAQAPNENYAREFFELFSLGADSVYTQQDIEELARILTGWSIGWVERANFRPNDILFQDAPESDTFRLNLRLQGPLSFPNTRNWSDETFAWAFVLGHRDEEGNLFPGRGHDWGQKALFLDRYGGVDSLGIPLSASDEVVIPGGRARTVESAVDEFDRVLNRVTSFRDNAKFISSKLIQLFVVDDLERLPKVQPMRREVASAYAIIDQNLDGRITQREWLEPVPQRLPNGRPLGLFRTLDLDGDGVVNSREFQEPDLLVEAIDTWRRTDGNLREVLRTILLSEEFLGPSFRSAKVKTPFELVVSTIRALEGEATDADLFNLSEEISRCGMDLFLFPDPTGESELTQDWMHTVGMLERLKFLNSAAHPSSGQERRFGWESLEFEDRFDVRNAGQAVELFNQLFLGGSISDEHREFARRAYSSAEGFRRLPAAAAFVLSLPQVQKQ